MESQIYYRPSNQETADYLQHCLGRRSDYARSETLREGTATSEGRTEQGIPLMTSQEIKQLRDDDIIGFHRLLHPFRATRMDWRRYPILTQRRDIPPPPLAALPILETQLPDLAHTGNGFLHGYIDPDI
jgi:type IV secretory pathway TraG/TraD family ATPase VirD4